MDAHDPLKNGLAANHSIYNLSSDMLLDGGFSGNLDNLDTGMTHLSDATNCMIAYLRGWAPYNNIPKSPTNQPAPTSAINFIRGGQTSYNDGGGKATADLVWEYISFSTAEERSSDEHKLVFCDCKPSQSAR